MSDNPVDLLGQIVRVWDAQHGGVFVEGEVISVATSPTIFVRTHCECGRETSSGYVASLPIEVRTWTPRRDWEPEVPK